MKRTLLFFIALGLSILSCDMTQLIGDREYPDKAITPHSDVNGDGTNLSNATDDPVTEADADADTPSEHSFTPLPVSADYRFITKIIYKEYDIPQHLFGQNYMIMNEWIFDTDGTYERKISFFEHTPTPVQPGVNYDLNFNGIDNEGYIYAYSVHGDYSYVPAALELTLTDWSEDRMFDVDPDTKKIYRWRESTVPYAYPDRILRVEPRVCSENYFIRAYIQNPAITDQYTMEVLVDTAYYQGGFLVNHYDQTIQTFTMNNNQIDFYGIKQYSSDMINVIPTREDQAAYVINDIFNESGPGISPGFIETFGTYSSYQYRTYSNGIPNSWITNDWYVNRSDVRKFFIGSDFLIAYDNLTTMNRSSE